VLPEAFAADADRLARFTREAQTLAALNHPNIAQLDHWSREGPMSLAAMVCSLHGHAVVRCRSAVDVRDV